MTSWLGLSSLTFAPVATINCAFAILCNEVDSAVAGVALLAIRDRIS